LKLPVNKLNEEVIPYIELVALFNDAVVVFILAVYELKDEVAKVLNVLCDKNILTSVAPTPALAILLFTDALNAATSPIPKTDPDNEPVIEPLAST
jgi:hypothetical protein